ncbi:Uncharacterised protein [Porphyromonas cangingivalis]|uniref:hypothetical protein n=1 Tax=Porphyromonas cangingivalis TaxID=36874 RepID=UPI000D85AE83|nr:hypothetical protein [Porphyromonas cangingivalis]SPY34705.1 Uncharacterised protein [Porphyromonas cangingivalis]
MKAKLSLLFITLFMSCSIKAQTSPFFNFEDVYHESFIGVGLGTMKMQKDLESNLGVVLSINFCGGFISYMIGLPKDQYSDGLGSKIKTKGTLLHAGYQIPFHDRFRLAPVIGYASFRKYDHEGFERKKSLDFGAMMIIDLKNINLYATYTKFGFYAGCSIEVGRYLTMAFPLW